MDLRTVFIIILFMEINMHKLQTISDLAII